MVVVLDHLIVEEVDVAAGLKPGGLIIINSPAPPDSFDFNGMKVATADVTHIAAEAGLPAGIVNTGIIGAFAKASGLIDMDTLTRAIEDEFEGKHPEKNSRAARVTFENTIVGGL
jgi:2-oxoacid:acceptor oxidoreductase gamma subunit (pyruvate/2-ketoisovalerate family)